MAHNGGDRRLVAMLVIGVLELFAQAALNLAMNAASSDDRWPGVLDFVRQRRWWSVLALLIVGVVFAVLTWRWQSKSESTDDSATAQQHMGLSAGSAAGIVNVTASDSPRIAGGTYIESMRVELQGTNVGGPTGSGLDRSGPLQVFYVMMGQIDYEWENPLLDAVSRLGPSEMPPFCMQAIESEMARRGVDIYVLLYGAAQHLAVKKDVLLAAKKCREANPAARILFAACGLSEQPVSETEMHEMAIGGMIDLPWHVHSSVDPTDLSDWLYNQLRTAMRLAQLQGRLRASIAPVINQQDRLKGGAEWSDPTQ